MAHFARLNPEGLVLQIIVVSNENTLVGGVESEQKGIDFCKNLLGHDTIWKQTSYNSTFRKNYASIGGCYNETLDAFIPPKPIETAVLDETTCKWVY